MTDDDDEVQRLKSLVKDLELQNTALRSLKHESHPDSESGQQKQDPNGNQRPTDNHQLQLGLKNVNSLAGRKRQSLSSESDGDNDYLDLTIMASLDDDSSWLFSSPHKGQSSSPSADQLKRKMLAAFESAEVLPRRRALTHKLKEIDKGNYPTVQSLFALRNSSASSAVNSQPECELLSSSHSNSFNNSYNGEEGDYSTAPLSSSLHTSHDYQGSYTNGATSRPGITGDASAMKTFLLSDNHASSSTANLSTPYSTHTFTRAKKKHLVTPLDSAHISDNDTDTDELLPADTAVPLIHVQPPKYSHSDEPNNTKPSRESRNRNDLAAGDSSTFVRRRNQTRTIESSAVLEAQRLLTDSPSSLEQSENDSLSALPDQSFRRRDLTGNTDDKSKRESLDIQTLAKLQEQSLRDSLSAVRKASTSSAGSGGVPSLNFSDLDSSNGSLSSSNEESFSHRAAPTLELNGDTPILHKSVVNSRNGSTDTASSGRQSPQIRSSLSPRSIQAPKASGLRKPRSSLPAPAKGKTRAAGGIPAPRSSIRPPTNTQYNSTR